MLDPAGHQTVRGDQAPLIVDAFPFKGQGRIGGIYQLPGTAVEPDDQVPVNKGRRADGVIGRGIHILGILPGARQVGFAPAGTLAVGAAPLGGVQDHDPALVDKDMLGPGHVIVRAAFHIQVNPPLPVVGPVELPDAIRHVTVAEVENIVPVGTPEEIQIRAGKEPVTVGRDRVAQGADQGPSGQFPQGVAGSEVAAAAAVVFEEDAALGVGAQGAGASDEDLFNGAHRDLFDDHVVDGAGPRGSAIDQQVSAPGALQVFRKGGSR